jgi:hypothetical protein
MDKIGAEKTALSIKLPAAWWLNLFFLPPSPKKESPGVRSHFQILTLLWEHVFLFLLALDGGGGWWGERPREPLRPISALFQQPPCHDLIRGQICRSAPTKKDAATASHRRPLPLVARKPAAGIFPA